LRIGEPVRGLTALAFRVWHALHAHPGARLLLGALLVVAGVLALLIGLGHGGLIAAGAFVLASALAAIRRKAVPKTDNAEPPERLAVDKDHRP
jgi:hypothetical protein